MPISSRFSLRNAQGKMKCFGERKKRKEDKRRAASRERALKRRHRLITEISLSRKVKHLKFKKSEGTRRGVSHLGAVKMRELKKNFFKQGKSFTLMPHESCISRRPHSGTCGFCPADGRLRLGRLPALYGRALFFFISFCFTASKCRFRKRSGPTVRLSIAALFKKKFFKIEFQVCPDAVIGRRIRCNRRQWPLSGC